MGFRKSNSFGSGIASSSSLGRRIKASGGESLSGESGPINFGMISPKRKEGVGPGSHGGSEFASMQESMIGSMAGSPGFGNSSKGKSLLAKLSKYLDQEDEPPSSLPAGGVAPTGSSRQKLRLSHLASH